MDDKKYIGMDVHQGMSSEGWRYSAGVNPARERVRDPVA
jgi:hypothetical protein